jgi:hypothetical protein
MDTTAGDHFMFHKSTDSVFPCQKKPEPILDPKKQQQTALQHCQLNQMIHNEAQYGANICVQENLNYAVNKK